jgi:predicted RNase H-like HicB family nuclease
LKELLFIVSRDEETWFIECPDLTSFYINGSSFSDARRKAKLLLAKYFAQHVLKIGISVRYKMTNDCIDI